MHQRKKLPRSALLAAALGGLLSLTAFATVREPQGRVRGSLEPEAAAAEKVAGELSARERSINRREATIEEREAELQAIEARLAERAAALDKLRADIDALRGKVDEEHHQKVLSLVKTVSAMKPAQAGNMLQKLDRPLAIEVMQAMSAGKAAKLLAALPPDLAAEIVEGLAGPGGPVGTAAAEAALPEPKPADAHTSEPKPADAHASEPKAGAEGHGSSP